MKILQATILLTLICVSTSQACQRCGLFGNRCRYYKAPVVYAQPVAQYVAPVYTPPQLLVVNNVYPPSNGLVGQLSYSQQGNTQYGYQQAAAAYFVSPPEMIRQSAELAKAASATFQLGLNGYNSLSQTQLALQANLAEPIIKSQAAVNVLSASGLNPSVQTQGVSQRLEIELRGNEVVVTKNEKFPLTSPIQAPNPPYTTQLPPNQNPEVPPAPEATTSIIQKKCGKCHSGTEPKGGVHFDGQHRIPDPLFRNAIDRLTTSDPEKKMPKNDTLTSQEGMELIRELISLKTEE